MLPSKSLYQKRRAYIRNEKQNPGEWNWFAQSEPGAFLGVVLMWPLLQAGGHLHGC